MNGRSPSSPGLPAGTRFGEFLTVRPLAAGGMAELYLAARELDGAVELAAVKRMLPHLGWDPEFVRMFLDEVRIAARLCHPNIVRVIDFGVGEGGYYLAMEYLHGRTLRALQRTVGTAGTVPLAVAVGTVIELATGLHAAHEFRNRDGDAFEVVHRDVSPSNVMVTFDGAVKLLDFGIARVTQETQMTRAGTLKGKVGYMSPEQCRGDPVDRRSDVFGLGVLLYELTVGRRAFWAESDYAVVGKVIDGDYIPPGRLVAQYPAMLEGLIARALHNDPAARPPTADALAKDLRQFAGDHRLDLEAAHRAAVLRDRCGIEPFPVVDLAALARRRAKRRPGSTGRLVGLLGLGATIGVAGFFVGGLARSDEAPEVVPGPKSAVAPLREAASTDQPDALPTVVPQPPDPREREPDDDRGEADLRPELEASGARPVRAGSPRRRSRSRRKTAARPTTGDPDTLLPPTLRKP